MDNITVKEEKFIRIIGEAAREDWQARHMCLPSLVTAIAFHAVRGKNNADLEQEECPELFPLRKDGHRGSYLSVRHAVESHNDYIALWKGNGQKYPNWRGLAVQEHYILAVQYLQDAEYPYCTAGEYEKELVELIEKYGLNRYDEVQRKVVG